jgi:hypothetical protein
MTNFVKKQLAAQKTAAAFPYLIKITHDEFPDMLYVNASQNITYAGDIYNAASFAIQPPDRDGSKIGDATLTISAVDQVWIEKIRATQKPAKLQFMAVMVYEEGAVSGIEPLEENQFTLRNVSWNDLAITWSMSFDENMAVLAPVDTCAAQTTPGCA